MRTLDKDRADARLVTLRAAAEKYTALVDADPSGPKAESYKVRLEEFKQSIHNIKTYRMESITPDEMTKLTG